MSESKINFASDNYSGVHANVLEWLQKVNAGPTPAYGADPYTAQVQERFKLEFGSNCEAFLVWNGTAANVLGLQALLKPHQAVICSELAHIVVDECGAPEKFTGSKLITIPQHHGKISVDEIEKVLHRLGDQHAVQPKVISISQTTEYGTVYSSAELKALSAFAKSKNMYFHVDGARICNAAVSLNLSFKEMITECGVDVLSFGGSKNGLMGTEAILILNPSLVEDFKYIRKQGLHLSSKMRFLSAQFIAYFENDLWKKNASQANEAASLLANEIEKQKLPIKITHPTQGNAVFMILPTEAITELQKKFSFYVWNEVTQEIRIVCSFNTNAEEVRSFVSELKRLISA